MILSNSPIIMKIWNFKLTVTSRVAIAKGLKGKDIGDYIYKIESELFKKGSLRYRDNNTSFKLRNDMYEIQNNKLY